MTPHTQIPPDHFSNLPWYLMFFGAVAAKMESVSMKTMLAIAGAIILALGTWGFTATHSYFQELRHDQLKIAQDVKSELKDWRIELKADIAKIGDSNTAHEATISKICEKLDNHIKQDERGKK